MKRALQYLFWAPVTVVAACATSGGPAPAAAPAPEHAAHEQMQMEPLPATAGPGYTVADVRFMQDMIGHHAQALTMSGLAPSRGTSDHVMMLVEKIDISQRDEIAMMKAWLVERGQAVPDEHSMHMMHDMPGMPMMPGMLTAEQMARLEAARGIEFERLFLTFMIQHHEGALVMVDTLFASPGAGQDSDIFRFATDVAADQLDEIDQMQYLLSTLAVNRGSESR